MFTVKQNFFSYGSMTVIPSASGWYSQVMVERGVGTVDPCGYGVSLSPNRTCTFPRIRLSILEFLQSFGEFASME